MDQFDHIACDSILFSREYLEKYANLSNEGPEKEFYLIEAFYYYRKALDTTSGIVIEAESCMNNCDKQNGVAYYRLRNIYNSLCELRKMLSDILILPNEQSEYSTYSYMHPEDFILEFTTSNDTFRLVEDFIHKSEVAQNNCQSTK